MKSGPRGLCNLTSKLCSSILSDARLLSPRRARFPPHRSGPLSVAAIMSQDDVVVGDRDLLEMKTVMIEKADPGKLQLIADFDGGHEQMSHRLLQQGNVEFNEKWQALFDYYHPSEYSPSIPIKEKIKLMEEW